MARVLLCRAVAVCVAAVLLAAPLQAAEPAKTILVVPEQRIEGADSPVPLGEIVDLSVSPIRGTVPHLASTSYTWRIYENGKPKRIRETPDGHLVFGTGLKDKTLLAQCVVVHLYVVKDGDKVVEAATRTVLLDAAVVIGGGPPDPRPPTPPTPPDPTPPTPSFPDGRYKLSGTAWKAAMVSVPDPQIRRKGAAALCRSYRELAKAFEPGGLTMTAALEKSKTINNQALKAAGIDITAWDDFGLSLQKVVYGLYRDKQINTVADLAVAWSEVAAGLEKVE